jgi:thiol-disulfide isomerase/thioredoxin
MIAAGPDSNRPPHILLELIALAATEVRQETHMIRKLLAASRTLLALGVLYGTGLASVHAGPAMPRPMVAQKPAKTEPAVAFTDAAGRHALASFKGHYVLLNMWATWCGPCVAELPALTKLKASVPGLTVLAVNMDKGQVDAAGFLKSHNAAALGSLRDTDITLMRNFGAFGLPTTVLIDPKGNIIGRAEGPAEWASLEAVAYVKSLTG